MLLFDSAVERLLSRLIAGTPIVKSISEKFAMMGPLVAMP
jgi:hypothetical protein